MQRPLACRCLRCPVVQQVLWRKLGLRVNAFGVNPYNQDAEDLYQETIAKIVEFLRAPVAVANARIENFEQYVACDRGWPMICASGTIPTGPSKHISDASLISLATLVDHRMNWGRLTFVNTNFTL